jgi:hypothetical protein
MSDIGWARIEVGGRIQKIRHFFRENGASVCGKWGIDPGWTPAAVPDGDKDNCRMCRNIIKRDPKRAYG